MEICKINKCTGCNTCAIFCPTQAIKLIEDKYGFFYPNINSSLCVDCHICQRKCPSNYDIESNVPYKAFASWSLDKETRKKSASGGVATEFYKQMISHHGVAYGVQFNKNLDLIFNRVLSYDDITKIQGSKYTASHMRNVLDMIKEDINNEKKILFIGLPCQVAAVKHSFSDKLNSIILVDIICHGVPSNKYLKDHLAFYRINDLDNILFRDENDFKLILLKENKVIKQIPGEKDKYITGFKDGLFYRESCYNCLYAKNSRVSDLTIGDFWGLGTEKPFNHAYEGAISLVLVNTVKGENYLNECKDNIFLEERTVEEALKGNAQLNNPSVKHEKHDQFIEDYNELGFQKALHNILKSQIMRQTSSYYKKIIINSIKKLIKKFLRR